MIDLSSFNHLDKGFMIDDFCKSEILDAHNRHSSDPEFARCLHISNPASYAFSTHSYTHRNNTHNDYCQADSNTKPDDDRLGN
jgi:hypothetical protein